jgi:hypothetical protein
VSFVDASSLFNAQLGIGLINRGALLLLLVVVGCVLAFHVTNHVCTDYLFTHHVAQQTPFLGLLGPFPHSPVHQIIMRERTLLLLVSLIVSSYSFYATAFVIPTTLATSSTTTRTRTTTNTSRRTLGGGFLIAPLRVAVDTSEIKKYVLVFSLVENGWWWWWW